MPDDNISKVCCVPIAEKQRILPMPPSGESSRRFRSPHLVPIPGGEARIGTDRVMIPIDGEGPARTVRLRPFWISALAVTNAEFEIFVEDTGYVTEAEHYRWSYVFQGLIDDPVVREALPYAPWWLKIEGASWRCPEGPGSHIGERRNHPVVHVSWNDATAFAKWAGGRLPTEVEWEHAARGGLAHAEFPWGDEEPDDIDFLPCNIWQGVFPDHDTGADGFRGTAPVSSFLPNAYGLYNMAGNTWEWCSDIFRLRSLKKEARSRDRESLRQKLRVLKGGSYLCHRSYCYRYRIAARTGSPGDTSTGHVGFRVVFDESAYPLLPGGSVEETRLPGHVPGRRFGG